MAQYLQNVAQSTKRAIGNATASNNYLKWNHPSVEPEIAKESEKIEQLIKIINSMQENNYAEHHHGRCIYCVRLLSYGCLKISTGMRATHVKTQGIVKGILTVEQDLPEHLAQGIFASCGSQYQIAARFANEPYKRQGKYILLSLFYMKRQLLIVSR